MKPLRGAYSLDASVLIEILAGSKLAAGLVNSVVASDVIAYAARLGLTEALYVACRLWSRKKSLAENADPSRLGVNRSNRRREDMGLRGKL